MAKASAADSFLESLMDTSLYSMGAFFSDEHPDLVDEVIAQSEAIERAGIRSYAEDHDLTRGGLLRDAAHGSRGALLQRRRRLDRD